MGSATTRYIYSGSKPIAEYVNGANANSPSTEYIYAGSKLLVTIAGSTTTYHHPDHLSNRAETNSSGTRTRTFGQLPFGETWYETGTADKWKFTGYEHDSGTGETGLDYANFRYYSSPQGRFMSADLLGGNLRSPQSLNRYSYVRGDPVNLVDPLGLEASGSAQCPPGKIVIGTDEIGRNICGDPGFSGGGHGEHPPLQDGGAGGGGGSNGQQKTDDCHLFADLVEELVKDIIGSTDDPNKDVQTFMDALATTFTEFRAATGEGLVTRGGHGADFGSTGFAPPYYEADEIRSNGTHQPSNQVRHAVGGLIMGYVVGAAIGLTYMDSRENPNDLVHGVPDINLNGQTVPKGNDLAIGIGNNPMQKPGSFGADAAKGLADWIRDNLCEH